MEPSGFPAAELPLYLDSSWPSCENLEVTRNLLSNYFSLKVDEDFINYLHFLIRLQEQIHLKAPRIALSPICSLTGLIMCWHSCWFNFTNITYHSSKTTRGGLYQITQQGLVLTSPPIICHLDGPQKQLRH